VTNDPECHEPDDRSGSRKGTDPFEVVAMRPAAPRTHHRLASSWAVAIAYAALTLGCATFVGWSVGSDRLHDEVVADQREHGSSVRGQRRRRQRRLLRRLVLVCPA